MTARGCVAAAALLAACTAPQSARTLPPGHTLVSVGYGTLARPADEEPDGSDNDDLFFGQVMVRHGLTSRLDAGAILSRFVNASTSSRSMVQLEPKLRLTPAGGFLAAAVSVGAGVVWSDDDLAFDREAYVLTATAYGGYDLAPTVELVVLARGYYAAIDDTNRHRELSGGGSIGVRFTDAQRTIALHPEIGVTIGDRVTYVTFGLSIAVGN